MNGIALKEKAAQKPWETVYTWHTLLKRDNWTMDKLMEYQHSTGLQKI